MSHTFISNRLKVSSEALVAISHSEGQQHDIGGRHQGERAGHRLTQPAGQRYSMQGYGRLQIWQYSDIW